MGRQNHSSPQPKLLFVTDLCYEAKGRDYGAEDVFLTSVLREQFDLAICHPKDTEPFESAVDGIVVRNSGSVIYYQREFEAFRERVTSLGIPTYNSLDGKADVRGKQYLVDLTLLGLPVIPTVDSFDDLERLPSSETYVIKPKTGADSIGMRMLGRDEIDGPAPEGRVDLEGCVLQPRIRIRHEISFYFIDADFQYALYAPDSERRWQLAPYEHSPEDVDFAQRFIRWNSVSHGIQRVDACRTEDGELLLVELEDLNPYLSLHVLEESVRRRFLDRFVGSLRATFA